MKAALTDLYGPPEVVRLAEQPEPEPGPGEIKVRVAAAGVNSGDARMRGMDVPPGFGPVLRLMLGLTRPRRPIMGSEFVGQVEALGPGAEGFAPGDRVMGMAGLRGGAHAEVLTIASKGAVLHCPDDLGDAEAAGFFFGGLTAAYFLIDKAKLAPGERVLVNGATGSVGSAAIQIARHLGARVTAVCGAGSAEFARELGAEEVIDYGAGPIRGTWDVVMDVVGTLPWSEARDLLAPGGRLLLVTAGFGATVGGAIRPSRDGRRIIVGTTPDTRAGMERLLAIHAEGGYRPVVGATFPFDGIVEAHRLAQSRHKRGSAVVLMRGQATP